MLEPNYNDCFTEKWIRFLAPSEWRGNVKHSFQDVPISQIEHAGCLTDPDVVTGWVRIVQEGRPIPPLVASRTERGTYYLHDGNHRFEALRAAVPGNCSLRVAVVDARPGFRFRRVPIEDTYTYELQPDHRHRLSGMGAALTTLLTVIAIVLTVTTPGTDSVFLVVAVLLSARFWGWLAGLLSTAINAGAAAFLLYPPLYSFHVEDLSHWFQLAAAALVMLSISFGPRLRLRGFRSLAEPRS
jgi:hypothetical protein